VHPDAAGLARRVRSAPDVVAKLDGLRSARAGRTSVIVTCGPSLATHDHHRLRRALDGVFTIAVKQAAQVVDDQADIVCFNSFNVRRLSVSSPATIRVFAREHSGTVPQLNRHDLALPMAVTTGQLSTSVAATRDFAAHELTNTPVRPWGPGIVHEVALYLALHVGVRCIYVIGWDIALGSTANVHFDDPSEAAEFYAMGRGGPDRPLTSARAALPRPVKRMLRMGRAVTAHPTGRTYNRTSMLPEEGDIVAAAMPATTAWLAGRGVELRLVGEPTAPAGVHVMDRDSFYEALERQETL
jgi:hypothetical protein